MKIFPRNWLRRQWSEWKNVVATTGSDSIVLGFSMLAGLLTARLLLPKGKGELTAVILWPSLFQAFGSLGLEHAAVYFGGKKQDDLDPLFGNLVLFSLVQGLLIAISGVLSVSYLMPSFSREAKRLVTFLFLLTPIILFSGYLQRILQGVGDFNAWNSLRMAKNFIYAFSVVILWVEGIKSLTLVVGGYILSRLTVCGVAFTLVIPKISTLNISVKLLWDILVYGLKNYVSSILGLANKNVDQAIMSIFLTPTALGLYKVAVSSTKAIDLAGSGFKKVVISQVARSDEESGTRQINRSLKYSAPILMLVAGVGVLVFPYLIPFLFGSSFSGSVLAAQILAVGAIFYGLKQILHNGVRGLGYPELLIVGETGSILATAAGLYYLLPLFGIEGAALASIFTYLTGLIIIYYMFRNSILPQDFLHYFKQ